MRGPFKRDIILKRYGPRHLETLLDYYLKLANWLDLTIGFDAPYLISDQLVAMPHGAP